MIARKDRIIVPRGNTVIRPGRYPDDPRGRGPYRRSDRPSLVAGSRNCKVKGASIMNAVKTGAADPLRIDEGPDSWQGRRDRHHRLSGKGNGLGPFQVRSPAIWTPISPPSGAWGAELLISLIEEHEYVEAGRSRYGRENARGAAPYQDAHFRRIHTRRGLERRWDSVGKRIRTVLGRGGKICVHCMGGLGRLRHDRGEAARRIRRRIPGSRQVGEGGASRGDRDGGAGRPISTDRLLDRLLPSRPRLLALAFLPSGRMT